MHSALSLPLLLSGQVIGAINVYAHDKDVFDEHAAELGELFAKPFDLHADPAVSTSVEQASTECN